MTSTMPFAPQHQPPRLTDGRIYLRQITTSDVDDVYEMCQDYEMQRWTTIPLPYTYQHALDFTAQKVDDVKNGRAPIYWVITDEPDGRFCGGIDLRPDGLGSAEVGYCVAPWARGHGFGAAALRLACAWGLDQDLSAIVWLAAVGNTASRKAAERVGFHIHDHVMRASLPERITLDIGRTDCWIGDLVRADLDATTTEATP